MFMYRALIYTGTHQQWVNLEACSQEEAVKQLQARFEVFVCLWIKGQPADKAKLNHG